MFSRFADKPVFVEIMTWALGLLFVICGLLFAQMHDIRQESDLMEKHYIELRLEYVTMQADIRSDIKVIRGNISTISDSICAVKQDIRKLQEKNSH